MMQLNPDVKIVWMISYGLRTIFFCIISFLIDFFFLSDISGWPLSFGILTLLVFILGLILTFTLPPLRYKYWKFQLKEEELYLERGVLTKIYTTAPYCRVQHIDIAQGVIERMFNLSRLVIFTAGTRGADLVIPGLPHYYAQQLRDQLKEYTIEDAV